MLREEAALQAANGSASGRTAFRARTVVSWRALVAAALLSLVVGAALFEGVVGERSSVARAVRPGGVSHEGLLSLPLAAQGPVSAALGADSAAYRVSASDGRFAASSPAQHLSSSFGRSGVSVSSGATHVGLSLQAVGYGTSLRAVGTVTPTVKANRVVYARAGLSEWYVNGPLGLEQGFTIANAPSGHAAGPLTLSLALSGNAYASLGSAGQSIRLSRTGGPSLRYSGLSATDARGRVLRSWLQLRNGRLLLRVDTRGARYPLRIDPFFQREKKLTCGCGEALFGWSVALSSNGNTALIGGIRADAEHGGVWVFTRSGSTWNERAGLPARGMYYFGSSVALSADGNTALIGSYEAGWVFTLSGEKWTLQAQLSTEMGDGEGVALSADGNTALVSGEDAAWVFTRSGSTWTQQGEKLTGSFGPSGFGNSVALSSDGDTALIGGRGTGYVFTRSGEKWTQQAQLSTEYGNSVALSSDGNTALIGSRAARAAWVFTRSGSTWTQQGEKLTGGEEGQYAAFGQSVALSSEGDVALIGGPEPFEGDFGAAWVFTRSGETWTQQGEKLTGSGGLVAPSFGWSVALSAVGDTALIGGYFDYGGYGAAWVFYQPTSAPTVVTGTAASVALTSASVNATVNPNGGAVSDCRFEYGTTESYGSSVPCTSLPGSGESPVEVSAPVRGLSEETTYHFRIAATNPLGTSYGSDQTFTTLPHPPTVVTGTASSVALTSASLNATVNPNGGAVSDCRFEYGTTESYGSSVACTSLPGSGESPVEVSAPVRGLSEETTYYFRIVATNSAGTSYGGAQTFTTLPHPPTVVTGTASSVGLTSASLNATVNPNGGAVSDCRFEYGTTESYGSSVPCTSLPGSGTSPVQVSAPVRGLSEDTIYHFRIVATNSAGTSYGGGQTFVTLTAPEYGRCAKITKDTGKFASSVCTSLGGKNSYEWDPGVFKTAFTTKLTSGTATFETIKGAPKVTCTGESSTGQYTGHKTIDSMILTLAGCERSSEKCSNSTAPGEIISNPLEGVLGVEKLGASSSKNKIGLDLFPVGKTGPLMEFSCSLTTVSIRGSVIVPVKANKMSLTQALKFKATKGKQKPESFVGEPKDILEASFNGGPFEQAGLTLTTTLTNEEEVEVNSVY